MARYTFFHNPMSRSQIVNWALHEVEADFETVEVDWQNRPAALLEVNPMGKIPTLVHHTPKGDQVVTEAAAICHYIAEVEASDLLPSPHQKASYYRWMFFAAGPLEQAVTNNAMGWKPDDPKREGMLGYGSYERTIEALDKWLSDHEYVCGATFTMADVYVGAAVHYGLTFGTIEERPSFRDYAATISARDAFVKTLGAPAEG